MFYLKHQQHPNNILSNRFFETSFPHNMEDRHSNNFLYFKDDIVLPSSFQKLNKTSKLRKLYSFLKKNNYIAHANYLLKLVSAK